MVHIGARDGSYRGPPSRKYCLNLKKYMSPIVMFDDLMPLNIYTILYTAKGFIKSKSEKHSSLNVFHKFFVEFMKEFCLEWIEGSN